MYFRGLGYKTTDDVLVALYGNQHSNAVMRDKIADIHWIYRHGTVQNEKFRRELRDRVAITEDPSKLDAINEARRADRLEKLFSAELQSIKASTIAKIRSRTPGLLGTGELSLPEVTVDGGTGDDDLDSEGYADSGDRRNAVNRANRRMLRGVFAGTPKLRTEREVGALRNSLLAATKRGAEGRFWYEQGARALFEYVGGDIEKYDKITQLIALYSANKAVVANLTVALQGWNEFISGKPITAGGGLQAEKANRLMYENDKSALGDQKVWSFYQNMMHPIDPARVDPDAVTVDIWMMRAFGYEPKYDKNGKKKSEVPTRAQYRFISGEVQRIAKKLGWRPYEVQAAIWVAAKAKGEGTPIGDSVATDWSSLLADRLGQISYEAEPHPTTGHLAGLSGLPWRVRADYMKQISEAFLDGNGRDMLAYALRMLTPGSFFGVGAYESDITPGEQFQTFSVKRMGAKGLDNFKVSHEFKEVADLYAAARGLLMHQQAVAWTMPIWNAAKVAAKNRNMAVIDIRDGSTGELRAPTVQETSAIYEKIKEKTGYEDHAPVSTGQGWWVNNLEHIQDEGFDNKQFQKLIRSAIKDFDSELDVTVSFIPSDTGYIGNNWSTKPDGEAYRERIEQGPPDIQQGIDSVYAEIQARIDAIDNQFSISYGLPLRPEVQERIDRATWDRSGEEVGDEPTRRYAADRSELSFDAITNIVDDIATRDDYSEARRLLKSVLQSEWDPIGFVESQEIAAALGYPLDMREWDPEQFFEAENFAEDRDESFHAQLAEQLGMSLEDVGAIRNRASSDKRLNPSGTNTDGTSTDLNSKYLDLKERATGVTTRRYAVDRDGELVTKTVDGKTLTLLAEPTGVRRHALDRNKKLGVFYSRLGRVIEQVAADQAGNPKTVEGLRTKLVNKGVTPDELFWSGFDDHIKNNSFTLDSEGRIDLTKLADSLDDFEVTEELIKGRTYEIWRSEATEIDDSDSNLSEFSSANRDDAYETTYHFVGRQSGTSYSFTHLHDSDGSTVAVIDDIDGEDIWNEYEARSPLNPVEDLITYYLGNRESDNDLDWRAANTDWESHGLQLSGGKNYGELAVHLPGIDIQPRSDGRTHYPEGSVVAHGRFQEFASRLFKRILNIEEIQSDHNAMGRSEGYRLDGSELEASMVDPRLYNVDQVTSESDEAPFLAYDEVRIEDSDVRSSEGSIVLKLKLMHRGATVLVLPIDPRTGKVTDIEHGPVGRVPGWFADLYNEWRNPSEGFDPDFFEGLSIENFIEPAYSDRLYSFDGASRAFEKIPSDERVPGWLRKVLDKPAVSRSVAGRTDRTRYINLVDLVGSSDLSNPKNLYLVEDNDGLLTEDSTLSFVRRNKSGVNKGKPGPKVPSRNFHLGTNKQAAAVLAANQVNKTRERENNKLSATNPFQNDWIELIAKRLLHKAVVENHDAISWTTAVQQVDRYSEDLRQVVDEVKWGALRPGREDQPGRFDFDDKLTTMGDWALTRPIGSAFARTDIDNKDEAPRRLSVLNTMDELPYWEGMELRPVFASRNSGYVMEFLVDKDNRVIASSEPDAVGKNLSNLFMGKIANEIKSSPGKGIVSGEEIAVHGQMYEQIYEKRLVKFFKAIAAEFGTEVIVDEVTGDRSALDKADAKAFFIVSNRSDGDQLLGTPYNDKAEASTMAEYLDEEGVGDPDYVKARILTQEEAINEFGRDELPTGFDQLLDKSMVHKVHLMPINDRMRESIKGSEAEGEGGLALQGRRFSVDRGKSLARIGSWEELTRGANNWEQLPDGRLVGYRVSRSVGGRAVSGADSRQSSSMDPGARVEFRGDGVFVTNDLEYAKIHYGVHDKNAVQRIAFSRDDVTSGRLLDAEPEISIGSGEVLGSDVFTDPDLSTTPRTADRRYAVNRNLRNTDYDSSPNPPDQSELATPFWKVDLPDTVKRGDGTTNLNKQTFGNIKYKFDGVRLPKKYNEGRGIPLVVPYGRFSEGPTGVNLTGYGERKIIGKHGAEFPANTIPEHETYQHVLRGLVAALSEKHKNKQDTSGDVFFTSIESQNRLIVFWDDAEFSSPVMAVLDYKPAADKLVWMPERYELVSLFTSDTFNEENLPRSKWNSPKHGRNVSVLAMKIFDEYRRPDAVRAVEAKVNSQRPAGERRFAVDRSSLYNTPAQQGAINHFMGEVKTSRSFIGNIIAGMAVNIGPDRIQKFRRAILDEFNQMKVVGKKAEASRRKDRRIGLDEKEQASVSAHAMGLLTSRAGALAQAALKYGFVKFTKLSTGADYEGSVLVEEQDLKETSEGTLYYDKSTGKYERGSFTSSGLYPAGKGGLGVILAPLGGPDNNLLPRFWAYARALRVKNLLEERPGTRVPMLEIEEATGKVGEGAIKEALAFAKENPEIAVAHYNLQRFNKGMVDFLVDTGTIDQKMAKVWLKNADYIPFYLNLDGKMTDEMQEIFRRELGASADFLIIDSLIPQLPKKLKGHDGATMDPMESLVANTNALITAGLKNLASRRAIRDMVEVGTAAPQAGQWGGNQVVRVFENGKPTYYEVKDPVYFDTLVGIWDGKNPAIGALQSFGVKGAQLLREGVTHMPDFIVANTTRDALLTWINHGVSGDRTPMGELADSFKRLVSETIERQKGNMPGETYKSLERAGALGGIELKDVTDAKIVSEFNRSVGSVDGLLKKTWNLLGDMSQSAEAAARERVQERVYDETLKKLLDKNMPLEEASKHAMAEAGFQAQEILNFSRHGSSAEIRLLTSVIPFLNARIQGLDVFARNALSGENVLRADSEVARNALWQRGALIAGATVIYALMKWDDEDYNTRSLHERENNWIFNIGGFVLSVPIPFEAGIVFKAMPEHAVRLMMGETSSELLEAATHHMAATMQFNPIPQVVKPVLETAMNKSFFHQGDIIPPNLQNLDPKLQYRGSTSAASRILEKLVPDFIPVAGKTMNPLMIDNLLKGYFGSAATVALGFSDIILHRPLFGFTDRATRMWSEQPILKRFLKDEIGRGNEAAFYKLKEESDAAVRTVNILTKQSPKEVAAYRKDAAGILRIRGWVNNAHTQMKNIRHLEVANEYSDRSPDEKARIKALLKRRKSDLTSKAVELRRELDSY